MAENLVSVPLSTDRRGLLAVIALAVSCGCSGPIGSDVPELGPSPVDRGLVRPAPLSELPPPISTADPSPVPVRRLLQESARRHGVNPNLVMAVAWWESGWDQSQVSSTGAIGIMQVEPETAATAGPMLLHRTADIHDPADNIELGTAVLKENLDRYNNDLARALVAYYAGPAAAGSNWKDQEADVKRYVWGVYRLALAFSNGTGPA